MDELPPIGVQPEEAIAFFKRKGYRIGFNWQDVFKEEHARAFTVAKGMSRSLLETIRAEVERALVEGTTLDDFRKALRPKLEAAGWWGRKRMIDPQTAQSKVVQLGSNRRLKTIFDTNLRTAYAAGKWERAQRVKSAFPFLEYSALIDGRERPEHHAWDGTILPIDDPWWDTHYPPCDWNCRCTVIPRSQRMLDRKGLSVNTPKRFPDEPWTNTRTGETGTSERGIGKGWDYNVGKESLRGLAPSPLPESFGNAEDVAGAAELTKGDVARIDRWLKMFGVEAGGENVWYDREGWPLSIGRGWFVAATGNVCLPPLMADTHIAAAIGTPDTIRWIWVKAENGVLMMMRRYARTLAGLTTIVDVGGVGWRWRIGRAADVEQLVAAAYNPHQKRDKATGRFARMNSAGFLASVNDQSLPYARPLPIGTVSAGAKAKIAALGIQHRSDYILLDRSQVRHILNTHGPGNENRPGHRPVSVAQIMKAHHAINHAQRIDHGQPKLNKHGNHVLVARHREGGTETHVVFKVARAGLTVHTMYRRKI